MRSNSLIASSLLGLAWSKLVVQSPPQLVDQFADSNNVIPANYANFGHIPYGQSLVGTISFDPNNPSGCTAPDQSQDAETTTESKKTKIVLVDRGQCSFVTKVRVAER